VLVVSCHHIYLIDILVFRLVNIYIYIYYLITIVTGDTGDIYIYIYIDSLLDRFGLEII